jgi:hypothetical protein
MEKDLPLIPNLDAAAPCRRVENARSGDGGKWRNRESQGQRRYFVTRVWTWARGIGTAT